MRHVIYCLIFIQIFRVGWSDVSAQTTKSEAQKYFSDALRAKSDSQKIQSFQKALELDPELIAAHLMLGDIYFKQGEYQKAITEFRAEIRVRPNRNPNISTAWKKLGETYLALNDKSNAAAAFEMSLGIKRNKTLFTKTIDLYIETKAYSKALSSLKKYRRNLSSADAHYIEGHIYSAQGKKQKALQNFQQALNENPNHELAKNALAKLRSQDNLTTLVNNAKTALQNNHINAAIQSRNQLAQKAPDHKELAKLDRQIAEYYLKQATHESNIDQALSLLSKASKYDKSLPELEKTRKQLQEAKKAQGIDKNYEKAIRAFNQNNWSVAIRYLDRVKRENPNYKDVSRKLQKAREEQQKALAEARKRTETESSEKPPDIESQIQNFFEQGKQAITQKQWHEAVTRFQSALQLKPDFLDAQKLLSYARGMRAIPEERWNFAIEQFNEVLELDPNHQESKLGKYYAIAREYANSQQWEDALSALDSVISIAPGYLDVQTRLKQVKAQLIPESKPIFPFEKLKRMEVVLFGAILLLVFIMIAVLKSKQKHAVQAAQARKRQIAPKKPADQVKRAPQKKPSLQMNKLKTPQKVTEEKGIDSTETYDPSLLDAETRMIDKATPRLLNRYEVKCELGKGAMGKVYKVYDHKMERTIALKEIRVDLDLDRLELEKLKKRFRREALSAAKLSHPNIVIVYDIIESNDKCFIAMEYLDGINILNLLNKQKVIRPVEATKMIRQACSALYEAHRKGIIHRDIKPSNFVVMKNGIIKIVDFGVAKIANASGTLTQTGSSLGTPSYMSPEQIEGKEVDGRSDIFSLGVVFYEMLTGERPFKGESIASIIVKIIQAKPKRITTVRKNLPQELESIINKMLEKNPNDRYQTAQDIISDLDKIMPKLS